MTDAPQILLAHHLKALKLPTFLREYDKVARLCAAEGVDHSRYLMRLAEMEMIDRERRMVERRIKAAKFPTVKSLDSFDFLALPSLNKMLVLELARSDYIERRENIIAVGNLPKDRHTSLMLPPSRRRPTKRTRSSITEHSIHGINTSRFAKSVTYVSGTFCHLCLRRSSVVLSSPAVVAIFCALSSVFAFKPSGMRAATTQNLFSQNLFSMGSRRPRGRDKF